MKKVILGLSGGVDSSVSAILLKNEGYEVIGAFMRNWDSATNNDFLGNPTVNDDVCPQEVDYKDAVSVANTLNIPILRMDFINEYWNDVFTYFINEYKAYRTPNPDVMCNKYIKFDAFMKEAIKNGADYIAMGHYAKVLHLEDKSYLLKGKDRNKDQSYFLAMISQEQLRHSLFPLGDIVKSEVRTIANQYHLVTATKKDSTGICFIGERNFKEFLKNYLPSQPGNIVTEDGKVIGKHDGLMYYTIGQRKGLNIGGMKDSDGTPWFVIGKNLKNNTLIVGEGYYHEKLYSNRLIATNLNCITDPIKVGYYTAKFRYREKDRLIYISKVNGDEIEVKYPSERAVTPGQVLAIYQGEICLGGAIIDKVYQDDERREY